jgi:hypothetical protein
MTLYGLLRLQKLYLFPERNVATILIYVMLIR